MRTSERLLVGAAVLSLATVVTAYQPLTATTAQAPQVAENELGGIVTGPGGPEAGVWVIAETTELPTKYVKIVVTDDRGRYLMPELPKANYSVWVRGYGLIDSPKQRTTPGRTLNLTAVKAPSARAAAEYYPSGYWYSLMQVPPKSEFPGTGIENGNGFPPALTSQASYLRQLKSGGCTACHQLGTKGTREIPTGFCRMRIRRRCGSVASSPDRRAAA